MRALHPSAVPDTPATRSDTRLSAARLVAFTDAVVAIGITLLVLPLIDLVPEAASHGEDAVAVVTDNLVPIGSFLLSFAVIWRIWTVHHRVFAAVESVGTAVSSVNMGWLACIVFLPFPVDLIGTFGTEPVVLALYVGALLASSIALAVMASLLRRSGRGGGVVPSRRVVQQVAGNAVGLAVAFVIVLTVPSAGFWPLLLLLLDGPVLALLNSARRRPGRMAG